MWEPRGLRASTTCLHGYLYLQPKINFTKTCPLLQAVNANRGMNTYKEMAPYRAMYLYSWGHRHNGNMTRGGGRGGGGYFTTDGQSVCLGIENPCGTWDQILLPVGMLLSEICGLVSVGRPLWREDWSAICSIITQWSESRRTRNHTLLSHLRLPQPGGPGSRIYIPQEEGGPVIPQGTGWQYDRQKTSKILCHYTHVVFLARSSSFPIVGLITLFERILEFPRSDKWGGTPKSPVQETNRGGSRMASRWRELQECDIKRFEEWKEELSWKQT
jgi:hypothetical protein